jgi:hypothetical protein
MSAIGPAGPNHTTGVTAVGLVTLLFGLAYGALGGSLVFVGDALAEPLRKGDQAGGLAVGLWLVGVVASVAGALFLAQGVLGLLAGWGVLGRKPWGRVLALILAALAVLWGLLSLGAYAKGATYIVLGAAQLLYGTLAFIILIRSGQEFSGRHPGEAAEPVATQDPAG